MSTYLLQNANRDIIVLLNNMHNFVIGYFLPIFYELACIVNVMYKHKLTHTPNVHYVKDFRFV